MPYPPSIRVGEKYGSRTVIEERPKKNNALRYLVRCDCGAESEVFGFSVKRGAGCGKCVNKKPQSSPRSNKCGTHGEYLGGCKCSLCRAANAETAARYRKTEKGKEIVRNWNLKKYGITSQEYDEMLLAQDNACAICKKPETRKNQYGVVRLAVDHCHDTGKNRGLLCMSCNRSLGMLNENIATLEAMIEYIEKHKNEKQ